MNEPDVLDMVRIEEIVDGAYWIDRNARKLAAATQEERRKLLDELTSDLKDILNEVERLRVYWKLEED